MSLTQKAEARQVGKSEKLFKVPGKTLNMSSDNGNCSPLAISVRVSQSYHCFPQVLHAYIPKIKV